MTLAAADGANAVARGGEGAKSEFNITLERNTEYILKLVLKVNQPEDLMEGEVPHIFIKKEHF